MKFIVGSYNYGLHCIVLKKRFFFLMIYDNNIFFVLYLVEGRLHDKINITIYYTTFHRKKIQEQKLPANANQTPSFSQTSPHKKAIFVYHQNKFQLISPNNRPEP